MPGKYYFNPEQLQLTEGRPVIVETVRGVEFGWVVVAPKQVSGDEVILPLKRVVRVAQAEDLHKLEENQEKSREALTICAEKIQKHGLDMRLVDAEYTFDNSKVIFYFTADGHRLSQPGQGSGHRSLKPGLSCQIGVRDEAKMLGGLGSCGRPLCCSTFLNELNLFPSEWPKIKISLLIRQRSLGSASAALCAACVMNRIITMKPESACPMLVRL